MARELARRLVVYADAIGRLVGAEPNPLQDLGARLLRGRASPVRVYAMTGPTRGR